MQWESANKSDWSTLTDASWETLCDASAPPRHEAEEVAALLLGVTSAGCAAVTSDTQGTEAKGSRHETQETGGAEGTGKEKSLPPMTGKAHPVFHERASSSGRTIRAPFKGSDWETPRSLAAAMPSKHGRSR